MSAPAIIRGQEQARTLRSPVRRMHIADFILPVSLGCWACGVRKTDVTVPGPYGLPVDLPVIFYVGIALFVISVTLELARDRPSRWRMSVHAAVLVVMLYGTAPLVYSQGRYSWLYKTIGVVQYVNAHGSLDRKIDIYQNWPGFFALAAWFDKIAGVSSPLAYAKWAQPVFEFASLPFLYLAYSALSLSERQCWVGLLLYSGSNWVGQDYLSPQALGTLFSLGIMAIVTRWLHVRNSAGARRPYIISGATHSSRVRRPRAAPDAEGSVVFSVLLVFIYSILTFTHELSPYILAIQLSCLAAARLLRPRWLPLVLLAIAVGYMVPRFTYVNSHYGILRSLGDFFANAATPKHGARISGSERLIDLDVKALTLVMLGLAIAGAWLRRRSRRTVLALLILAFSPVLILGLQSYGQEAILRVYLFSLPWAAALAASALAPVRYASGEACGYHRRSRADRRPSLWAAPARDVIRVPVGLATVLILFFPAFYGNDSFNVMTRTEVVTLDSFLQDAVPGPIYSPIENAPLGDTAKYYLFPQISIFGSHGLFGTKPATSAAADLIANNSLVYTNGEQPAYVVITSSMAAYNAKYELTSPHSFAVLLSSLAKSPAWRLVDQRPDTTIYELLPISANPGGYPAGG